MHHNAFNDIDIICGVPPGGALFATILSYKRNIPMISLARSGLEGKYRKGDRVLLVEDMVSTGASTRSVIDTLKSHELNITKCLVLLSGDDTAVAKLGIPDTYTVFKLDFIKYMIDGVDRKELFLFTNPLSNEIFNTMLWKGTNIIVSCNLTDTQSIMQLVNHLYPDILGIKLHSDIIVDFNDSFIAWLIEIKKSRHLFIIEDRKLSTPDPELCKQQLHGAHRIASWADAVTVSTEVTYRDLGVPLIPYGPIAEPSKEASINIGAIIVKNGCSSNGYLTMTELSSSDVLPELIWIIDSEIYLRDIALYKTEGIKWSSRMLT
jgi:uridine monophosphate synthetase